LNPEGPQMRSGSCVSANNARKIEFQNDFNSIEILLKLLLEIKIPHLPFF
jgi:hypothetical protein